MFKTFEKFIAESLTRESSENEPSLDVEKTHKEILKFLNTFKGAEEIRDFKEFPNKYGAYSSTFWVKHSSENKWSYSFNEFKILYSEERVHVLSSEPVYRPYKNVNDIKKIIKKEAEFKK